MQLFNWARFRGCRLPKMPPPKQLRRPVMHSKFQSPSVDSPLMELMFTLTVLGILLGLAVPSFMATTRNNRLIAQNNEFVGALNLARSEALKMSGPVSMCASTDEATCSGDTDWSNGWIVFSDQSGDGNFDGDPEVLLRSQGAAPSGIHDKCHSRRS